MKLEVPLPKPFLISKDLQYSFSPKRLKETLNLFTRAGENIYLVVDYYKQKLIVGSALTEEVTGYSSEVLEREGFDFYKRILSEKEINWLIKFNLESHNFFASYPLERRHDLEFHYDLIAETINGSTMILHHKLVPYQLCRNGNMWLGLCFVTNSTFVQTPKAAVIDSKTGERFNFIDDAFQLPGTKVLSLEDLKILRWLAKDFDTEQLSDILGISASSVKRKKRDIFAILGVKKSAAAVFKAHSLGLI